jgi:uncharacterized protein (TIGR03437 family)
MTQRLVLSLIIVSQTYLNAASSSAPALQWVKTLNGSGTSAVATAASDGHGNFYIAGSTTSLDLPAMAAAQPNPGGSPFTRINTSSGALQRIYSPPLAAATSVTVDPGNSQVLYATSPSGLSRSTDGGNTWKAIPGFPAVTNLDSVAVDPTNNNVLYAATTPLGVLKSTDGGATWTGVNNGIPTISNETVTVYGFLGSAKSMDAYRIWADTQSPGVLFVFADPQSLMRSADGGASWSVSTLPAELNGALVADPFAKGTIYAPAQDSFYKSTDDGQTWTSLAPLPDNSQPYVIAADPFHQATLYGGTTTSLFESTDSGQTWEQKIMGITTQIASDPHKPVMYASVMGLGIVASTDGFTTYKSISPANTSTELEIAGAYLFAVAPPTTDVFVTKLDPNGNIVYSTYFGGSGSDYAAGMALGNDGSVYVTGSTNSTDFPVTKGAYATSGASFVFKLNPDGSLAWSTYFADGESAPYAITVDSTGNPYLGGQTSGDLPVTPGAYETQFTPTGCSPGNIGPCFVNASAFLTKFNAQGSSLVFSTYIFQNRQQQLIQAVNALALAPNGNIYFAYNGFNSPIPSASGVYLMNATGSALIGSNISEPVAITSITLGKDGNLYATGSTATGSTGPTFRATPGAFQSVPVPNGVDSNAFVLKFDGTLSKILAATLLGGEGVDSGASVALDASLNVIVGGYTDSKGFPARAPFQGSFSARSGFVTGLDSSLSDLLFSTYLGDTRPFIVQGAVPDGNGNVLVAGATQSSNSSYYSVDPGYPFAVPSTVIMNKIALPLAPLVRLDSAVNYASRLGVPLSPGEAIEVLGSGFGSDAKLMLDGNPLPVVFANENSIVAVVPNDAKTSGSVQLTVSNNGVSSNPVNLLAGAAAPGIYTSGNSGFGQAYILNADGTRNSQSNPTVPGAPMTILATGVGQVSSVGPYVVTDQPVAVFADGFYVSGIAAVMKPVPGLPGDVYEISVYAPDLAKLFGANPDNHIPVIPPEVPIKLFIGSAQSQQGVMLWVKPD